MGGFALPFKNSEHSYAPAPPLPTPQIQFKTKLWPGSLVLVGHRHCPIVFVSKIWRLNKLALALHRITFPFTAQDSGVR